MLGLSASKFEPYWRLSCLVLPLAVYTSFDMIIPAQVLLALVALFLLVVAVVVSQKSRGKRFPPGKVSSFIFFFQLIRIIDARL